MDWDAIIDGYAYIMQTLCMAYAMLVLVSLLLDQIEKRKGKGRK